MGQSYRSGCLICGNDLVYLDQDEELTCAYCGVTGQSNVRCIQGHFICDSCHSLNANDLITQYCEQTTSTNPVEMAILLMKNPSIKMHGPEHHYLVPAVLLTAYYNRLDQPVEKTRKLNTARQRSEQVKGGSCGFLGNCGAGVGTGIFMSLATNSTPLSRETWRLCNLMTARSLSAIAEHGGPRCCKRDTYLALIEAAAFTQQNLGVELEMPMEIRCSFSGMNRECLKEECPFFTGN